MKNTLLNLSILFLFRLKRNSFFYKIILGAIIILVSLGFSKMLFGDNRRLFIIWQSLVMLGLQLILNNKELRMKFTSLRDGKKTKLF